MALCFDFDGISDLRNKIRSIPLLSNFEFKMDSIVTSYTGSEDDDQSQPYNAKIEVPRLTGAQCDAIIRNAPTMFSNISNVRDQSFADIWLLWCFVCFGYLEATNQQLDKRGLNQLDSILKRMDILVHSRFQSNARMGYYYHIVVKHLPELLAKHGSLFRSGPGGASSQGFFIQHHQGSL